MIRTARVTLAVALAWTAPAAADDYDALRADAAIHAGLTIVAIGRTIERDCDAIEPRLLPALAFVERLRLRARLLGYTGDQIEAYVDDEAEQDRYQAIADAWLRQEGADPDVEDQVCAVGFREIDAATPVGRLLREE